MDSCYECGKPANRYLKNDSGEATPCCWSCYSDLACSLCGLDSAQYKHPEMLKVLGRTFALRHEILMDGVCYSAFENSSKSFYRFSVTMPFDVDGTEAVQRLKKEITRGLKHKSLNREFKMLEDEGFLDIIYDEKDENSLSVLIDGKLYSSSELLGFLRNREGWQLEFRFKDSFPHPEIR